MVNVFAPAVFFICLRETIETAIIVSVLLSFLKQTLGPDRDPVVYKKLVKQVWVGVILGLLICLIIGATMIGVFYRYGNDLYAKSEDIYEAVFALLAAIIITIMGAALLRISKLQAKWRMKIAKALEARETTEHTNRGRLKHLAEKYAMFILPFITVLREGTEAVVFIGGVSLGQPARAFPLAVCMGLLAGILIGLILYKGGNFASLQVFLIVSTCFLYLVAAGLFSKAVWSFEIHEWNKVIGGDASEVGSGPGSYDIRKSVWHVNCCNPEINGGGGWGVFNSLFGWQNSATYGSVISYNIYWLAVIAGFVVMRHQEKHGHLPFMKELKAADSATVQHGEASSTDSVREKGIASNVRRVPT